jgi:DNA-binding transcriptional regulator LsrR (DeoR family)
MQTDRDEMLAQVASLYYEDGLTQQEISRTLGYSRSSISRLLSEARREGVVEIHVHHPIERSFAMEQRLQSQFGLKEVRVLQSSGLTYPQMLRRLGALAGRLLEGQIREHSILGISWGTALFEVASALPGMHCPGVRVVQIIGSATSRDHLVDGPGLARAFARQFGGEYFTLPAPWLVEDKAIRDALLQDRRMRQVLDLARQADIALVGIGTVEPALSSMLRAGYLDEAQLRQIQASGAVGDVCGLQFDRQGKLLEIPLAGYAFGVDAAALRSIRLVIGVAGGAAKAPAILGALRAGLVSALVTDDAAAEVVLREAG